MFKLDKFLLKKVNIRFHDGEEEHMYSSLVQDYSTRYLFLSVPIVRRRNILIPQDSVVDIFYVDRDRPYYFTTRVIGNFSEEGNTFVVVERPGNVICYDRRKFKRVRVVQKVKIVDLNSTPSIFQGEILNLSATSAKIKVKATGLRDKNYLFQFKLGVSTFHLLGYPNECDSHDLVGNERLHSLYIVEFNQHDSEKLDKLKSTLERLADVQNK